MKTPKEEAENIVNEFRMVLMQEDTDCGCEILCTSIAIKNALIMVNRIINEVGKFQVELFALELYLYWVKVKTELEIL
jgi:hypothetical protein